MYVDTHLGTASLTMKLPFKVRRVSKICNSSVSLRRGLNRKRYNDNSRYGNNVYSKQFGSAAHHDETVMDVLCPTSVVSTSPAQRQYEASVGWGWVHKLVHGQV